MAPQSFLPGEQLCPRSFHREFRLTQKEKVRVFALARELDMESKDLLTICRKAGIDVKNQLSTLEPDQRDRIVEMIQKGGASSTTTATAPPPAATTPVVPQAAKVRNLDRAPRPPQHRGHVEEAAPTPESKTNGPAVPPVTTPSSTPVESAARATPAPPPAAETPRPAPAPRTETHAPRSTPPTGSVPPPRPTPPAPARTTPTNVSASTAAAPTPPSTAAPPSKHGHVEIPSPTPTTPAVPHPAESGPITPVRPTDTPRPAAQAEGAPPPKQPEQPARPPAPAPAQPRAGGSTPPPRSGQTPAAPGASGTSTPPQQPVHTGAHRPMRQIGATPPRQGGGAGAQGGGQGGQGGDRRSGPRFGLATRGGQPQRGSGVPQPHRPPPAKPQEEQKKDGSGPVGAKKLSEIPPELLGPRRAGGSPSVREIEKKIEEQRKQQHAPPGRGPATPAPTQQPADIPDDDDDDKKGGKGKRPAAGGVPGRADRHKDRAERQQRRKSEDQGRGKAIGLLDDDSPRHRKDRHHKIAKIKKPITEERKGAIPISLPITVRSLCEAIGAKQGQVLFKLKDLSGETLTINSSLEPDVAEMVALEFGKQIEIKRATDAEGDVVRKGKEVDRPEDLVPRAPIVTIMGHVDHGKTSLLDKIRHSNITATEAGGITQVIRAWRVEHDGKPITFLDTPGHEAFTKMRARGAQVTDIAVIVVAADDGVMPQTEEAIAHAKAAGVSIVVAINKCDLPSANIAKVERQLYSLELLPDNMGGDIPFVQTSAATGKGIDNLLESILIVAEFKELKANPNKPATGTCLEAHLSEKEGVLATLLIQDGTLKDGDVVLCGATFGTVRKMYNDLRQPIMEAGPTVPVIVTGLDEVPNADDPFHVVADLPMAREIASKRKERQHTAALVGRKPLTIESLKELKITELKVILKAEAKGSIEAIRNELEKLKHEEVRVRILHAAIGAINASDVQLALTSPEDTLIVGFNVVSDNAAQALAEERGIKIREYNIIYDLANDIKSALEGKLKPREEVIHLGRAIVRQTFKISRVGTIAGCYVTQGVIERSAKVRVIRSGVVVYPPPERTVGLESLKRVKDDAREVREGFECGMKIAGFDDIKVDDVIEAYRIEQVVRTLS
jgi:translation initiation factor IF-2